MLSYILKNVFVTYLTIDPHWKFSSSVDFMYHLVFSKFSLATPIFLPNNKIILMYQIHDVLLSHVPVFDVIQCSALQKSLMAFFSSENGRGVKHGIPLHPKSFCCFSYGKTRAFFHLVFERTQDKPTSNKNNICCLHAECIPSVTELIN